MGRYEITVTTPSIIWKRLHQFVQLPAQDISLMKIAMSNKCSNEEKNQLIKSIKNMQNLVAKFIAGDPVRLSKIESFIKDSATPKALMLFARSWMKCTELSGKDPNLQDKLRLTILPWYKEITKISELIISTLDGNSSSSLAKNKDRKKTGTIYTSGDEFGHLIAKKKPTEGRLPESTNASEDALIKKKLDFSSDLLSEADLGMSRLTPDNQVLQSTATAITTESGITEDASNLLPFNAEAQRLFSSHLVETDGELSALINEFIPQEVKTEVPATIKTVSDNDAGTLSQLSAVRLGHDVVYPAETDAVELKFGSEIQMPVLSEPEIATIVHPNGPQNLESNQ